MALPITPPSTPEYSAQLQRIDILHQRLKHEAARTQEYLAKLKRGEEIHTHTHAIQQLRLSAEDSEPQQVTQSRNGETSENHGKSPEHHLRNGNSSGKDQVCCCQHHQPKTLTEKEKNLAEEYRKKIPPLGSNFPPLPTHVDEREVRDLEKRVRGLEGRVRGFEGLPPDREMALLEVERLRRELEGLARRREGLFGLMDEKSKAEVMKKKVDAAKEKAVSAKVNGKPNRQVVGKVNKKAEGRRS